MIAMTRFGLAILLACSTASVAAPSAAGQDLVTNKDLIELTDIDSPSISPDGRFAVFRTYRADVGTNDYVVRWHAIDLAAGTVRDIGSGGEPIYDDPGLIYPAKVVWTDDNKAIITRALVDGAIGLWKADVEGHGMTPLVVSDANVIDFSLTKDGSALDYTVGATRDAIERAETREKDSGILVDSTVDLAQSMFRSAWVNGRMASQRLVGYWWVRDGLLWRSPRQEHQVELQTGEDQPIGLPQTVPPFDLTKVLALDTPIDADGDVASHDWDGKSYSLTVRLKDRDTIQCADPICKSSSVSTISSIPGTNDFLIAFKDRERRQSLYRWSPKAQQLKFLASAEGLLNGGRYDYYPCAVSGETALCIESGPASPPRVESLNLKSGERQVLFDPNSRLRAAYHPRVRFFDWSIGGGRSVGGVLMLPSDGATGRAPLYLNYYTCEGFLRGGTGNEWPVSELLASGYAVLCMNSVPVYGPQHPILDYSIALQATQTAIDRLAGEGIIDRSKVVMGGLSFGSEAALWIAVHSHLLSALSISSGQFEPADILAEFDAGKQHYCD